MRGAIACMAFVAVGCAAEPAPRPVAPAAKPEPVVAPPPERYELPTSCAKAGAICTPPADFVAKLCKSGAPDVALTLFKKGMPWTRAWVRQEMEAWYASGGRTRPRALRYGEEVIIVADRSEAVQMTGAGSYDVYRWDGSCVSLMSDELTLAPPTQTDVAPIEWKHLHERTQEALARDQRIQ